MEAKRIPNKNRKGNEAKEYIRIEFKDGAGMLLTEREAQNMYIRYKKNPEDHTEKSDSFFSGLFNLFN
jgi:hypothetical protein